MTCAVKSLIVNLAFKVKFAAKQCTLGLLGLFALLLSTLTYAQEQTEQVTPQVGKHVMTNMDAGSMILSLLMVLGLIVISALVLKRFNIVQQGHGQIKVISSVSLGAKERVVVIQVGDKQMVLGVTSQQITHIETLSEPLIQEKSDKVNVPNNMMTLIQEKLQKSNQ